MVTLSTAIISGRGGAATSITPIVGCPIIVRATPAAGCRLHGKLFGDGSLKLVKLSLGGRSLGNGILKTRAKSVDVLLLLLAQDTVMVTVIFFSDGMHIVVMMGTHDFDRGFDVVGCGLCLGS